MISSALDKQKVVRVTNSIMKVLAMENFTAVETKALIDCVEALLKHQCDKHGIKMKELSK
jgi:hypothetical protein